MSHTLTQEPVRTDRRATRSQTRDGSQRLGSPLPERKVQNRRAGTPSPIKGSHVTTENSHGPIRGPGSRDPAKFVQTELLEYFRFPEEEETRVFGIPSASTLTRGSGLPRQSLRENRSEESFDDDQEYVEDVTYGEHNQEELLREIEQENETMYYDPEGRQIPAFLDEQLSQDANDEEQEVQEQGMKLEHETRSKQLHEKQEALDQEIEVLESERNRLAAERKEHLKNIKRLEEFHRKQAALREDLAQQQKIV